MLRRGIPMPKTDKRLLHLTDPNVTENFNRVLKEVDKGSKSVVGITLTTDSTGKVTGGTATLLDNSTVAITVAAAEST